MIPQSFTQDVKPPSCHLDSQGQYCRFETVEEQNLDSEPIVTNEREVKPSSSLISSQLGGGFSALHTDVPAGHESRLLHSPPQRTEVIACEAGTVRAAEATAVREAKTAARNAKATAIRQAHATVARERACQRAREGEAAETVTQVVLGSIVTYSAGLNIPHLITGFETCTLHIKNLPPNVREDEIRRLFTRQRIDSQHFHLVSIKKCSSEKFEAEVIASTDAGRTLAEMLDGLEFKGETLEVEVLADPEDMSIADSSILTIFWDAPSYYVAKFSDSTTAYDKVRELDRRIYGNRRVNVRINAPPPGHSRRGSRTNSIKISYLPPSITDEEVMAFTGSSSVKRLADDVEQVARTLRDDIELAVPNALERFNPPSESPTPEGLVFAHAYFSSQGAAHAARISLRDGYQFPWFQFRGPSPTMHFTITIPLEQYTAQKAQWGVLLSSVKERKACILNAYNVGNFVRIRLSGFKEAFGAVKVRVESLARGEPEALKWLVAPPLDNKHSLRNVSEGGQACPICMEDVMSPHQLGCGHIYCVGCLSHYISSSVESAQFPLTCPGGETHCQIPLTIPTIQHFLARASFNRLLEAALDSFVSKHPEEFKFCRTPKCSQIYRSVRSGESPKSLHCPSCFAAVCNGCDQDAHEGLTCADNKLRRDLTEQVRLNDAWIASQGGRVKKCPQCSVIIEKVAGCNDMLCHCGAHICWRCMGVFNEETLWSHRIYSNCTRY